MEPILQDLSADMLSLSIEKNLSSWIPVLGLTGAAKFNDPPGVNRSISPISMPFLNSIMDTQLQQEQVDTTIQYIKNDAEKRQVSNLWWVGPSTRPKDLGQQLLMHEFEIDEDGLGMAVILANLAEDLLPVDDLYIHPVTDESSLQDWCLALANGFEVPSDRVGFLVESWQKLMRLVDTKTTKAYLARWKDKPVATSLLQMGGGVAGIYAVATIPEARRKGIGAWVTLKPLLHAREIGYKGGILQSSAMGHGVYQSLGFQDCCRITSYIYRPKKL
jgi:GNAT superfamily N-acetyltransferase